MDLNNLRLFVQVADAGGFAAAARRLGMDPSLISRAIANLERDLGFRLFHRSTRKMALTTAGATYLQKMAPLLDELGQAEEAARQQIVKPEGRLTVTASTAFGQVCILPHVPEFQARYPDVELNLRFTDAVLDIVAEQIDLACRFASQAEPHLAGRKLLTNCFWLCASPAYLERFGVPVQPEEIAHHQVVPFNLPGYQERWLFKRDGTMTQVPLQPRLQVSNALAIHDLTLRGTGVSVLANWMVQEDVKAGRLVRLLPDYQVTATDFNSAAWLVYPSKRYLPAKTLAMVDFLCEKYAEGKFLEE